MSDMPQSVPATEDASKAAFSDIINRFSVLIRHQQRLSAALPVPEFQPGQVHEDRFLEGSPLITFVAPSVFLPAFLEAAPQAWAAMQAVFPDLAPGLEALSGKLQSDAAWVERCLRVLAGGDADALIEASVQAGVTSEFLLSALRTAWSPVITAARKALSAGARTDLWRKPYCPVCGSDPDLAVLENHPDPSEFLVSKSGEMWHHCPSCGEHWRFVRLECPGCGNQNHETMTRFTAPDAEREHIYACEVCHQYLPCLDLVESRTETDLNFAALEMVHLDAVAQTRGYWPLSPAPWAALGFVQAEGKVC